MSEGSEIIREPNEKDTGMGLFWPNPPTDIGWVSYIRHARTPEPREEKFKALFDNALDPIMLLELTPDHRDAIILESNQAASRMYGYNEGELKGSLFSKLVSDCNSESCRDLIDNSFKNKSIRFEMTNLTKQGQKIDVDTSSQFFHIKEKEVAILISRNITKKKIEEEKIRILSFRDGLTGLYNRGYFNEELKRLNTARQLPLSIIVSDLNGFKLANDAFGHKEGDRMLIRTAGVLKNSCRKEDIIARWGGDEFIILLPKTDYSKTKQLIKRIKEGCQKTEGHILKLSISMGSATKTDPGENISKILRRAEDRMYKNKVLDRKNIYSAILDTLLAKLRNKKKQSKAQIKDLENLAESFGKKMRFSQAKTKELMLLTSIYDIGKITIPNKILRKKERLTSEEWEIIKRHPEIGYHISEPTPQLLNLADAVLAHHEWWDGTGYPQRLKGKEIPVMARAVAILDAYDAMRRGSPYKKKLSKGQAIEELRRYSGIQFDPRLVKKFISALQKNKGA